ncbi:MAG: PilN domain-containing protein [Candidatus Wallbacteria bacterium]|nr:PilN domain-containing protein [Candidatus Wallbacteria bacterium]
MRIIRIDLIPKKPGMKMPKLPLGTIIGVMVVIGVAWTLWGYLGPAWQAELDDLQLKKTQLNKRKEAEIKRKQDKLDKINAEIQKWKTKVELIEGLISNEGIVAWTQVLERLTEIVPRKKVWLSRFTTEPKFKISVQGRGVDTVKNISEYLNNLKKDPYFTDIYLSKASKGQKTGQQEIWEFSLTSTLKKKIDPSAKKE